MYSGKNQLLSTVYDFHFGCRYFGYILNIVRVDVEYMMLFLYCKISTYSLVDSEVHPIFITIKHFPRS